MKMVKRIFGLLRGFSAVEIEGVYKIPKSIKILAKG